MRFAKWTFLIAGTWGVLILAPLYFLEDRISASLPPAIAHPEYFYGFVGVALAWQVVFFLIASDVQRYRLLMLPSVLEKFSFGASSVVLIATARIPVSVGGWGLIDLAFGLAFAAAFFSTRGRAETAFRPG